jgi:NADPH:quinone reductase-like Zn-dependent oxidoreductase
MRQVVIPHYGPPDVLKVQEIPTPVPGAGELRVAVRAAGVNFADIMARLGLYPDAPKAPLVPGYEVAGVVDAVGAGVAGVHEGDRVIALTRFGGYSSSAVVPAEFAFRTPARLNDVEAAALPVNYLTALLALYRVANVAAGETVLILGAGGGVGIAATQLALVRGAVIIGAASASKLAAIRALGVHHAIDYRTADVSAEVTRITSGRGADVILDPIGGKSFSESYRMLAPLGRLVMYGVSAVAPGERRSWWHAGKALLSMPRFKPMSLMNRNRGVSGLNLAHLWEERRQLAGAMELLAEEVERGHLNPVIAQTFPLERAADAHRLIHSRRNVGKVILTT